MKVTQLVFRRPTSNDFFNMYSSGYANGGGQSYIDVTTAGVSLEDWARFFTGTSALQETTAAGRARWTIEVQSIGLGLPQVLEVEHRRPASVNFAKQKLESRAANRVYAWHPDISDFPAGPAGLFAASDPRIPPIIAHLRVYLLRAQDGQFWAGMTRRLPNEGDRIDPRLASIFSGDRDGYVTFDEGLLIDPANPDWIFLARGRAPRLPRFRAPHVPLGELAEFEDDLAADVPLSRTSRIISVVKRNRRAAQTLKRLYGECQVTGMTQSFKTAKGASYLEAHHLVPLGKGGADHPRNLVVLSAQMHRMLHYATVGPINLALVRDNKLNVIINGISHTITWHPDHSRLVERALHANAD